MNCEACGSRCRDDWRFCAFCGVLLRVVCPGCGALNAASRDVCWDCSAPLPASPEANQGPLTPGRPLERRQLTIMFSDLVNSTALSDRLDPEDFRALIEAHRTAAAAPIRRYGGVVARYLGDGMLIYFGYPEAHEDDPDRAVRAGLEIVAATKALNASWIGEGRGKIAVRIGIHTGIVVVGDVIKRDVEEPMAVFGNPPSLAARLQAVAEPNSVVLSGATKALLRPTVHCEPRGQTALKGIAKPVEIFVASSAEGRSIGDRSADRGRKVLPFVDREMELSALRLGWGTARAGEGKAFLLAGDPGIGKSRLIRVLKEQVISEPSRWLVARTSPYAANSDFFAFSEMFREQLRPDQPADGKADAFALLQAVLAGQGLSEVDHVFGFANLLGLAIPETAAPHHPQPERLRDLTLGAITAWLERQSRDEPLVLVIEDLHWADASTLEVIRLLLKKLGALRMLLVMSSRQPEMLGDVDQDLVRTLTIERLAPDHAKTLLDHVVHGAGLSSASVATLLQRAAGVPLFIEELPKPVIEGGGRSGLPGQSGDAAPLPATLRDSLMAQLDRMGEGKSVAQTGAVLGHSFDEPLMRRVYGGGLAQMEAGLDALTEAGLLTRQGGSPEATYVFKHALLAEIAYDSILRQDCRQIHRRTADALIAHFPTLAETRPELIARHYAAANDAVIAFDYWMKAGKAAARRSANTEAIGHLRSAEAELDRSKTLGVQGKNERWLSLLKARAPVQIALLGWAADNVEETYQKALSLSRLPAFDYQEEFNAWAGLSNVYLLRGQLSKAEEATGRMEQLVLRHQNHDQLLKWRRGRGLCEFLAGRFHQADGHFREFISLEEKVDTSDRLSSDGLDPLVNAYSIQAWSLWFIGNAGKSDHANVTSIQIAEKLDHPFSLCYALCISASISQCQRQYLKSLDQSNIALDLAHEHAFSYWKSWASIVRGWSLVHLDQFDAGLSLLREGLRQYEDCGSAQMRGYALSLLAEANLQARKLDEAIEMADAAIAEADKTGIAFYKAEACRLKAEALLGIDGDSAPPVRLLLRALRLAEEQTSLTLSTNIASILLRNARRVRLRLALDKRVARILSKAERTCDALDLKRARERLNPVIIHDGDLSSDNARSIN